MVFSRLADQIAILGGGAKILALAPTALPPELEGIFTVRKK